MNRPARAALAPGKRVLAEPVCARCSVLVAATFLYCPWCGASLDHRATATQLELLADATGDPWSSDATRDGNP